MESFPVYCYYDGYEELWSKEPEDERERVRYIVLGDLPDNRVGICYVGELYHFAPLSKITHAKAWIIEHIPKLDALTCVRKAQEREHISIQKYRDKYNELLRNQHRLDREHVLSPGHSVGVSDGRWNVRFHYNNLTGYTAPFVREIEKRIHLLQLVQDFLAH